MDKKTFHKKWYSPVLQLIFWVSFILLLFPGIWAILYEDDIPFLGFIWIVILVIVYWLIKTIFYRLMFSKKNQKKRS